MLMLLLLVFCTLCGSLSQARDLEKRILFNRFYETVEPASCAHAKQDGPHPPPPPLLPLPQSFLSAL